MTPPDCPRCRAPMIPGAGFGDTPIQHDCRTCGACVFTVRHPAATPDEDTTEFVPLADLIALARLGSRMRRAQQAYFKRRKEMPYLPAESELRTAQDAERKFDAAVKEALAREQGTLPGMGGDKES